MPTRTMLPPNLSRHFYETRRAFLESAGQESAPWFQLSPLQRAVVESEMEIFRQAIRRAEEEQDLLGSLDATRAAANDSTPDEAPQAPAGRVDPCDCLGCTAAAEEAQKVAAAEEALQDCTCPGCSAVAAALKRLGRAAAAGLDSTYGLNLNGQGRIVWDVPARFRPWPATILAAFGLRPDEV